MSSVWPTVENPDLVLQKTGDSQSATHSRPAECHSIQAIQTRLDHLDRMVPPSTDVPVNMLPVVAASSGPVCHQVQQQTASVCITGSRSPGMGSGYTQPALGGSGT